MTTLVEIPGVGEVEFPDTMAPEQIQQAISQMMGAQQPAPVPQAAPVALQMAAPQLSHVDLRDQFGRRAAARTVANILSTPHAIGELLAMAGAGVQSAAGAAGAALMGQPANIGQRFAQAIEQQRQQFPASLLLRSPNPDATDVLAASEAAKAFIPAMLTGELGPMRSIGEIKQAFGNVFQEQRAQEQALAEQAAGPTKAADIAGDIATLLIGRPGTQALFRRGTTRAPAEAAELKDVFDVASNRLARITGFAKRTGSQMAEAGFEGAFLAAMNSGDPLATAGWSAGTQLGGSLALKGAQTFARYPWQTLGGLALAHWTWRALGPGRQGTLEEARDESIRTMLWAFGTGALAAMAGAGRLSPGRTAARDRFIDAFDTIRRAPLISLISQFNKAEEMGKPEVGIVIGKITEDPDFFGREARIRLERAARSEKADALIKEVDSLMRSTRFRQKFEELQGG